MLEPASYRPAAVRRLPRFGFDRDRRSWRKNMLDCECGMTVDQSGERTRCSECEAPICQSCSVEVDATAYCRWCAVTRAPARRVA